MRGGHESRPAGAATRREEARTAGRSEEQLRLASCFTMCAPRTSLDRQAHTGLLTKSDVQDTLDDRLPRAEGSSSSTGPVDGGRGQADDTRVPEAEVCPARVLEVSPRRPGREHSALSSDARPRRLPPTITLFFFLRMSFPLRRVRHLRRFLLPPILIFSPPCRSPGSVREGGSRSPPYPAIASSVSPLHLRQPTLTFGVTCLGSQS